MKISLVTDIGQKRSNNQDFINKFDNKSKHKIKKIFSIKIVLIMCGKIKDTQIYQH